jgi:peptidoglycan/LPS O-acetylase OafA/YrhL
MKYSIPTVLFDRDAKGMPLFLKEFLTKPYNHLNASTIGVIFAYYSFSLRKRGVTISRLITPLLQILGGVLLLVTLYLPFVIRNATEELEETEKDYGIYMNAAYNGLSRIFWALGLGLLALPSVVSPESTHILTRFASWRGWAVLGRLTFSMYLIHIIVLHVFFGTVLREYPFRLASLFLSLGGIFLWSCLLGSFLYVFLQSPLVNIVKLVTKAAK